MTGHLQDIANILFFSHRQGSTETKKVMMFGDLMMFFLDHRPSEQAACRVYNTIDGYLAICMGKMTME